MGLIPHRAPSVRCRCYSNIAHNDPSNESNSEFLIPDRRCRQDDQSENSSRQGCCVPKLLHEKPFPGEEHVPEDSFGYRGSQYAVV